MKRKHGIQLIESSIASMVGAAWPETHSATLFGIERLLDPVSAISRAVSLGVSRRVWKVRENTRVRKLVLAGRRRP